MSGYACNETPNLMPMPIYLRNKLTANRANCKSGAIEWLRKRRCQPGDLLSIPPPVSLSALIRGVGFGNQSFALRSMRFLRTALLAVTEELHHEDFAVVKSVG